MSLFDINYPNTIGIRAGRGLFEELYAVNPSTGRMERVIPGGGGGEGGDYTPPYWVGPDGPEFKVNDTVTMLQPGQLHIDDDNVGKGSLLNAQALTFAVDDQNFSFNAVGAKNLGEIGARVDKTTLVPADKNLIYDSVSKSYKTTPAGVNIDNGADIVAMNVTSLTYAPKTVNGGYMSNLSPSRLTIGNKAPGSTTLNTATYNSALTMTALTMNRGSTTEVATLQSNGLTLKNTSGFDRFLNYTSLDELTKLAAKTSVTASTANDRMLLWDATASTYKYTPIPASVALPSYLKDNNIELTASDNSGYIRLNPDAVNAAEVRISDLGASGPKYIKLTSGGIKFHPTRPTTNDDIDLDYTVAKTAFNLSKAEVKPVVESDLMLTWNPSTTTYGFSTIPTSGGTVKKVTLPKNSGSPNTYPLTTATVNFEINKTPAMVPLRYYNLSAGDELILIVDDCLPFNGWVGINVAPGLNYHCTVNVLQSVKNSTGTSYVPHSVRDVECVKLLNPIENIPIGTLFFKMVPNPDATVTGTPPGAIGDGVSRFSGTISIKMISRDVTALDEATPTSGST